eukprot:CAMPEP_0119321512 /NCGR_PEP_ID=MMETSP1333-20130426/55595_1 /TAXON_ID=418940 /ORGANISM="Scyphosphaera apsteinii, Strain RCC1455" /LENGTH=77 /DNA_ID=CAMNT_0007328501 /DNA_START=44 /DNA_END=277 /DNA_ORIENTATION=+
MTYQILELLPLILTLPEDEPSPGSPFESNLLYVLRRTTHGSVLWARNWDSATIVMPSGSIHRRLFASSSGDPSFTSV